MQRLGIVNLGLNQENFKKFKEKVKDIIGGGWATYVPEFNYRKINPTEIAGACDALVLSPGDAKVGLLDHKRVTERDAQIGPLYNLIHSAVEEGVPLIGINAGHEALNCSYGWAIDRIPDKCKNDYQRKQRFDLSLVDDPIAKGIESIIIQLTNNYAVLPEAKQRERWGQSRVKQLAHFMDYVLISKIAIESPVYAAQFNIQPGTEAIFKNFFNLAQKYLERKQA